MDSKLTLLIATYNKGKVSEIASMLEGLDCQVIGFSDLHDAPSTVEETGETFADNAMLKAEQYHKLTGLTTLADDSGLEVDALDGKPGVYSARYGGEGLSSADQIELLLDEMKDVPTERRTARFVCSIALFGENLKQIFEERCEGSIAHAPRGNGGFGYDPIFLDAETGRTFGELTREEKAVRSHRGKALRLAREFISDWLKDQNC